MTEKIRIGTLGDFSDGDLHPVTAGGTGIVVAMVDGTLHAARNHCPHLGFSLTKGPGGVRYADGQVQCPWHNSTFNLCTGANLDWTPGFAGRAMPRWSSKMIALGRKPAADHLPGHGRGQRRLRGALKPLTARMRCVGTG